MTYNLFVYGTLMFPEILNKLLGKNCITCNAVLHNFFTYQIKYETWQTDYPVIVQRPGKQTHGKLLGSLLVEDMELIGFYESDEYQLKTVDVEIDGIKKAAWCFLPQNWVVNNIGEEWDSRYFKETKLKAYVEQVIPETLREYKKRYYCKFRGKHIKL